MTRRTLAIASFLTLLLTSQGLVRAAIETSDDLKRVAEGFYGLGLDSARAHDVTNATIVRDIGTIKLTKGTFILSEQMEGVTPIAVFLGEGTFTVTPLRPMDRDMLNLQAKEYLGKDLGGMINTSISQVVFLSFDDTFKEIEPHLSAARAATPDEMKQASGVLSDRLGFMDRIGLPIEHALILKALGDPSNGTGPLVSAVNTADFGWLMYSWNPASTEEVSLFYSEPVGAYYFNHALINGHKKSDLDANGRYAIDPNSDLHYAIDVTKYRMDIEVPNLQEIYIDGDVQFVPLLDGLKVFTFSLVNDTYGPRWDSRAKWIDVTSITDSDGNELPFIHRKNSLVILAKKPPVKGESMKLGFKLHENTITQLSDVHFSLLNTYPWFPQYGYLGGQYEFDWTVKTVKPLTATGSGKTIKTWEEGNMNAVEMIFDRPVQFPSIIFGRYQIEEGEYRSPLDPAPVEIKVYSWPQTIYKFTDPVTCQALNLNCPLDIEVTVPRNKPADVVTEAEQIIKFMEDLYGAFPYDKLDVAMMAPGLGFGQAPPGFVQLTGEAFMSSSAIANSGFLNPDFFHEFFSHEIAHQWWGHKIGWAANDDQWLSEAFAEYSAGLYVLNYLGKKRFKEKMDNWRQNAELGDPHASIAFSNRLTGTRSGAWYTGLIYNKGPYVVHMLRMQMGLDNFKKAMQSLFKDYGYTNVTTYQLQHECEKVMGYNMDFFFDQWFRGTGIPVFDYSWTTAATDDGKQLVTIKVSQRDKENYKKVLMPVYLYFKGQDEPLIRPWPIVKADDEFKLKLPEKPSKIVLDEDHDILGQMILQGSGTGM